jgi:hypothetical protein
VTRRSERKKAAKAAEAAPPPDFVHTAAGKVGPLMHGAADRIDPMAHSAADWVGTAAGRVGPLAQSAADMVGPLTHAAADRVSPLALSAADRVGPYAHHARERVSPYAQAAMGRVSPYAHLATEKVGPLASGARQRSARVAQEALEKIGPQLDVALDAGRRLSDDLIPKLVSALTVAAGSDVVGEATPATAKGELVLPPAKKKRRWLTRFAILAALVGVAAVAARKFLGRADADWQAARPSAPYTPPQPANVQATSGADNAPTNVETGASVDAAADVADLTPAGDESGPTSDDSGIAAPGESVADLGEPPAADSDLPASDTATSGTDADASLVYSTESEGLEANGQPMESQSNEAIETELPIGPSTETALGGESPRYEGEGIYMGLEPPEGYSIKGNERSRKYHVPESAGYGRTTADIWFNSEEAAERAGFVRAQR